MTVSRKSKKNLSKKRKNVKSSKKTRKHMRKMKGGSECKPFHTQNEASEYIRRNEFQIIFKYGEGRNLKIIAGKVEQIGESEDKQLICRIKINKNNIQILNKEDEKEYNAENGLWIGWEDLCKPN